MNYKTGTKDCVEHQMLVPAMVFFTFALLYILQTYNVLYSLKKRSVRNDFKVEIKVYSLDCSIKIQNKPKARSDNKTFKTITS